MDKAKKIVANKYFAHDFTNVMEPRGGRSWGWGCTLPYMA